MTSPRFSGFLRLVGLLALSWGCASGGQDEALLECTQDEAPCTSNRECCGFEDGMSLCMERPEGPRCAALCTKNSDCETGCCAPASGRGPMVCGTTHCMGDLGAECTYHNECISRSCAGYCTKDCSSHEDCITRADGSIGAQGSFYCMETTLGARTCFPGCTEDADCSGFLGELKCRRAPDLGGTERGICTP